MWLIDFMLKLGQTSVIFISRDANTVFQFAS